MSKESSEKAIAPYGAWPSEVTAELVAQKGTRLGHMQVHNSSVYWLESRPQEQGRGVVVEFDGVNRKDRSPKSMSVGSMVHEYGGGDFVVGDSGLFFCNHDDQAVYHAASSENCKRLTEVSQKPRAWRFADLKLSADEQFLVAVRERHDCTPITTDLVLIDTNSGNISVIAEGADFYASPAFSPNGKRLAWVQWYHPQMPWDGTELWVADIALDGAASAEHLVCGGSQESVLQPKWSPDGVLHFISDRSGWWNLYSFRDGILNALMPTDNDCGLPMWNLGYSSYSFATSTEIYVAVFEEGQQQLAHLSVDTGHIEPLGLPFREYPGQIHFAEGKVFCIAGAPTLGSGVFAISTDNSHYQNIGGDSDFPVDSEYLSIAKPVTFTSASGEDSHAYFYEPVNPNYCGSGDEHPPLIVMSHGGPTGATSTTLNLAIQFWTSRGFAVVDVNYSGSTGFGRAYRQALNGRWGINDVNDCVYAARYLVEDELADPERLLIRGGSAGGFTTLCALTFTDDFAAGMTRYGVADLETLLSDTHKFESRYLDKLVGPYPESKDIYQQRSPIHHTEQLSCPLLVLQGADDKVVPPSQSLQLVEALKEKDIPHAYIEFEGEGHGFRKQATIISALQAELYFYRKVLGINAEESLPEIAI
ncbi:MAG: S9 family peptidase [Gammaproteobacteria bacterium]|nr:S9 family peptidase [Gammaproteobacteria bacterium]